MFCSGKRCPMNVGYDTKKCQLGMECPYYSDYTIELARWAEMGYEIADSLGFGITDLIKYLEGAWNVMEQKLKIVDFDIYCKTCKHQKKKENEEPCDECLNNPVNEDSNRPVNWEV